MAESAEEGAEARLLARFRPGGDALNCVAWAPDGELLAVGGSDHTVRILTPDGVERACLRGHTARVWSVAFSGDGQRIVSGSIDKTARLWDSKTGAELCCFSGHTDIVKAVAISQEGGKLATASYDRTLRLWDAASGTATAVLHGHQGGIVSMGASADFTCLASAAMDGSMRLWHIATSSETQCCNGHDKAVWSVAFAPDGGHVASGAGDHTICLWQASSGSLLARLRGHDAEVSALAFSPNGQYLASGSRDSTVRLWHLASQTEVACLRGHQYTVWSLAFAPDGHCLASVSNHGTLCLWQTADLATPAKAKPDAALSTWLARQAATLGWQACMAQAGPAYWVPHLPGEDGQCLLGVLQAENPGGFAGKVALSPDGRRLYQGTTNGRIQAWDLASGSMLWQNHEHAENIQELAVSPDGRFLASSSSDKTVRLCDGTSGTPLACLRGHDGEVNSVAFSPDGRRIVSGSDDKTIRLWDVASAMELQQLRRHEKSVYCVRFSPDGRWLASASGDKTIRLWQAESGAAVPWLPPLPSAVLSIAFAPHGQSLGAGLVDGSLRLWPLGNAVETVHVVGHDAGVWYLAFSPDGSRIASGGGRKDQTIRIWDAAAGSELQRFPLTQTYCYQLAWSPDAAFLVAGLHGDTTHIYDTRTAAMLASAALAANATSTSATTAATAATTPMPAPLAALPPIWATLHHLGNATPLSLLQDLHTLLAGQAAPAMPSLASHPGLHALQRLRWPAPARLGLIALLLHQWPGSAAWQAPANYSSAALQQLLHDTLHTAHARDQRCPVAEAPAAEAWLTQALAQVDERLLTLLCALGPQAVAQDPGLPLRLLPQIPRLPRLSEVQRRLLGQTLSPLEAGPAQGSGSGLDRAGLASHGPITALLPSQWAYPRRLLHWRHANGGLLYRTRSGREPPILRPMVIVLDTSPACWGVIEALTRPAAHALAQTLAQQQRPALLLTAGDNQVHYLNQPAERLQVFTHRSQHPVDIPATLAKAQMLCNELASQHGGMGLAPVIVLLTHCWWGAELEPKAQKPQPGLRALFVQYPNRPNRSSSDNGNSSTNSSTITPPFAAQCERWETLYHQQLHAVPAALGRLIG